MTDIQSRTEQMALAVLTFLDNNNTVWSTNAVYVLKRDALETKLDEINTIELTQVTDITGNAAEKGTQKLDMAQRAIVICGPLKVYAQDTSNEVLAAEVNFSLTDFIRAKDTDAEDSCQIVHDRAQSNAAALGSYGITPLMIGGLQTAITAFHDSQGKPVAAKSVVTAATQDLERAFGELAEILDALDGMTELYRYTKPTFYEGYHTARKRVDTGVRHISAQVHLIDKITHADLQGGTVEVQPIGVVKETGSHSTARLMDSETGIGTFDFVAHAQYYKDATVQNVVIEEGKITRIVIEMEQEA